MAEFSIIKAIEAFSIDPYPTKSYRSILVLLKNIIIIMQDAYQIRGCYLYDVINKLTLKPEGVTMESLNRFLPTSEIHKMLTQIGVSFRFKLLLQKLCFYILIKLDQCNGEDASSIIFDFKELIQLYMEYRKYAKWDCSDLDEILVKFQMKVISFLKKPNMMNAHNIQMFNAIKVIIIEVGKHSLYTLATVKQVIEEINHFYKYIETLESGIRPDPFLFEIYLSYLYVLNNVIGRNFMCEKKEEEILILSDLKSLLNNILALNKMRPRENYLIQTILRIIEVYQLK